MNTLFKKCRKFFFLPFLLALLLLGCKKDDGPKMPPPTKSGQDVLAFKVNGKVHIYEGKGSYLYDDGVRYVRMLNGSDSSIQIQADNDRTYHDYIAIIVHTFHIEIGKPYILSSETSKDGASYNGYVTGLNAGSVTFTRCDRDVAAGNFSFTGTDADGNKVEITEGFFDIKATL